MTSTREYVGRVGVSTAFGTFGELLQGVLPGQPPTDFLVTLPIARWSMATFRVVAGSREVVVRPEHKLKARRLATMMVDAAGGDGGVLTIETTLHEGKGMASSSADLVATARAVGNALGLPIGPATIEDFLRQIEPTDGVLYPGVVAFDHRDVRLRRFLGSLPMMTVVGLDEGGTVDTVAFNRIAKPFGPHHHQEYARLLDRITVAVARQDLAEVGAVATRSAELNQLLRPKRHLDAVIAICRDVGGLGVVAAHSGTMLGVLLDIDDPDYPRRVAATVSACSALTTAVDVAVYRSLHFG